MTTVDSLLAQIWNVHQQGRYANAEAGYRELLAKAPDNANAHVYLGIALFDQRRFDEAVTAYRQALHLRPFFPIGWNNLGNALRMLGRIDEADQAFEQALQQKPEYTNALKNRGTLWTWAGEIDRGLGWYERALKLAPEDVELHRNLGVIYLLQGDYQRGWAEYRWRWRMPGTPRPNINQPLWTGQPLENKTIFVYPEQGLGDTIQFARVIQTLQARGAEVVLGCEAKLVPLLSGTKNIGRIVPLGGLTGPIDYHASLLDVVDYTWRDEAAISGVPYLSIPQELVENWRRGLQIYTGRRIGIAWQGNPDHHADVYRSAPLEAFRNLVQIPGIDWISLQFGHGSEQLNQVDFASRVARLPDNVDRDSGAFLDTAAVVKNLDLVITIDSSLGHLAGAMGVPTWLLLNKVPDWRWGLEGSTTPWYQNHRLWRQDKAGDWSTVVENVAKLAKSFGSFEMPKVMATDAT